MSTKLLLSFVFIAAANAEIVVDDITYNRQRAEEYEYSVKSLDQAFASIDQRLQEIKLAQGISKGFKEAWERYLENHKNELYYTTPEPVIASSLDTLNIYATQRCLRKKQTKEMNFLLIPQEKNLPYMARLWLCDAELDVFETLQKSFKDFAAMIKKVEEILELKSTEEYHWQDSHHRFDNGRTFLKRSQRIFSQEESDFFRKLEIEVNNSLMAVLQEFNGNSDAVKYLVKGHDSWVEYGQVLFQVCEVLGIKKRHIKIRLLCYYLSRLYFYKKFFKFFTAQSDTQRCEALPPREHFYSGECDHVRMEKKLYPIESLPCCPEAVSEAKP